LTGDALAGTGEHRLRDVHAQDVPTGTDELGQLEQGLAAPAPDVEDPGARRQLELRERRPAERVELRVRLLLQEDPGLTDTFAKRLVRSDGGGVSLMA
jgi:glucan biosynthesis protein